MSVCSWTVHPIRRHHRRTLFLVLVILLTMGFLWIDGGGWFWVGFSAVVLLLAVRQYLLPTTFSLDDEGVASRFLAFKRRKAWKAFRSYYRDRNGVLLSPFPAPSRLENFRGMYLIFGDNADEVMAHVRTKIAMEGGDPPDS